MEKLRIENLSVTYDETHKAVDGISIVFMENKLSALIGPSGCGKSSLLRSLNRMHALYNNVKVEGRAWLSTPKQVDDILNDRFDAIAVRQRIGMVFQKPNPFPKSIFDNVAYGLRISNQKFSATDIEQRVQESLERAGLWLEVKDRLKKNALGLSGGQQQRLCIARALAPRPEVLLLDEPSSALDPIATARLEEELVKLKDSITLVMVTHNLQQAARISDETAFLYMGHLVENGPTKDLFSKPKDPMTERYVKGAFG